MKNQIKNLNATKPTTYNNIPAKILVEYCDIYASPIHRLYNYSTLNGTFPDAMKLADITPSHKKNDKSSKDNYRPISILSSLSKILKRKCTTIYTNTWIINYLHIYVDFERATPRNIAL